MKKFLLRLGGTAAVATIISGCSSVDWAQVGYSSPANEINLKANPKVKIVSLTNDASLNHLTAIIAAEFTKSGQIKIDDVKPDYWIVLAGERAFRADNKAATQFNRKVEKLENKNAVGGCESMKETANMSTAATQLVSVAVYSINDLSPVYYFDVALYDADFKPAGVRGEVEYNKKFSAQIIAKMKDAFLAQVRTIDTALPKNADRQMRREMEENDANAVIARAKQVIPQEFDEFIADVTAGKYKEKTDEMECKLSNYYVLALAREVGSAEPENLKTLHAEHITILTRTNEDGLSIACPNSLARIENKLKLLQALK